jgi:DNA oxidative demethylase
MPVTGDLLADIEGEALRASIGEGAVLLRRGAAAQASELISAIALVAAGSPFRRMVTPGGYEMSISMTNCGEVGWVTDLAGCRYDQNDPLTGTAWPPLPEAIRRVAVEAASEAG